MSEGIKPDGSQFRVSRIVELYLPNSIPENGEQQFHFHGFNSQPAELSPSKEKQHYRRLIVVSNRLPANFVDDAGRIVAKPTYGGLVTAMTPLFTNGAKEGIWVGWAGMSEKEGLEEALRTASDGQSFNMEGVNLTPDDIKNYYSGFSNEVLWLGFHELQDKITYKPEYWKSYDEVNGKFASKIKDIFQEDDFIWVQDYHLMLAGQKMREMGIKNKLGFFLHIPFPDDNVFAKMPHAKQLTEGLMSYDLVGFHTKEYRNNFLKYVRNAYPDAAFDTNGDGNIVIENGDKKITVGAFPISIDDNEFERQSRLDSVKEHAAELKRKYPNVDLVSNVGRLDPTKGLLEAVQGFGILYEKRPEMRGELTYMQVSPVSRGEIPIYKQLRQNTEQEIENLNTKYSAEYPGWQPVVPNWNGMQRIPLVGLYKVSPYALITPKRDGMNLVAKEYVVCGPEDGVLILGQGAGAAAELTDAVIVDGANPESVADGIYKAHNMDSREKRQRKISLRNRVHANNIYTWAFNYERAAVNL